MKPPSRAAVARAIAWGGLLLMVLSVVWLELLPRQDKIVPRGVAPGAAKALARVVIDPGHGGNDSGTMRNGVLEKDLTLDVALRVQKRLQTSNYSTLLTRSGDEFISLAGRAATANREQDCVLVSIHFDEGSRAGATGVQTFYAEHQADNSPWPAWLPFLHAISGTAPDRRSQNLAAFVQDSLVTQTQAVNRGTTAKQFYVVAKVRHPAVLIEGGFLTNETDLARLSTEAYREQLAGAIADGVMRYCTTAREETATLAQRETAAE